MIKLLHLWYGIHTFVCCFASAHCFTFMNCYIFTYACLRRIILSNLIHFILNSIRLLYTFSAHDRICFNMTIELALFLWWGTWYTWQHCRYLFRFGYLWDIASSLNGIFYRFYLLPCHFANRLGIVWNLFPWLYFEDLYAKSEHILGHVVIDFIIVGCL